MSASPSPSNTVTSVAAQLIANGKAVHARLGVAVKTIPTGVASALSLPAGVEVASVSAGSAADNAGLHAATGSQSAGGDSYPTGGDVITAVDGKTIATAGQFAASSRATSRATRSSCPSRTTGRHAQSR